MDFSSITQFEQAKALDSFFKKKSLKMGSVPEKAGTSTATRSRRHTDLPAQPKMAHNLQRRWS
jgi:hypothetical protein